MYLLDKSPHPRPPVSALFADMVLELMPHEQVLRNDSSRLYLLPDSPASAELEATTEKRLAVDSALSIIRQIFNGADDIQLPNVAAFLRRLDLVKCNRAHLEGVIARLEGAKLPTEQQVEVDLSDTALPPGIRSR